METVKQGGDDSYTLTNSIGAFELQCESHLRPGQRSYRRNLKSMSTTLCGRTYKGPFGPAP